MKKDVLPVAIRGILPANSGCAIFVGNDEKVFVIQVEHNMGAIIGMFLRETPKERPLTHDLMNSVLTGFGISVERVIITELKNSTYFARLILQQHNELGRKLVEIDARPSDCLALAAAQKKPIFVSSSLFEQVEDMSEVLERINENTEEGGAASAEEEEGEKVIPMPAAAEKATHLLLFSGDDDLAIKQKAKATFEKWCADSGGFDQERISGNAANSGEALGALSRLREALQTLPFFGSKVIWFQGCNFLGTDRTSESAAVTESLASLAEDLKKFNWEGVRLLITADSVDKRKSFYKTIAKLGTVEELNGWSIEDRDWVDQAEQAALQQIRSRGKEISDEALARLVNDAGVNNRHLANEIEKLSIYLGDRPKVTLADIESIISRNRQSRAFALADAVGARDLPRLVRTLDNELHDMRGNSKKSEIGLLYGVISKVRAMLLCKEMARKGWVSEGASYGEFQSQIKRAPAEELPADKKFNPLSMHPFMLHGALQHSRNYTLGELVLAMEALLQANLQLISTGLDEALILQQTLIKIVQPASHDAAAKKQKTKI